MDSGNSGSIQSSSGGDEEYDSSTIRPDHHHHHSLLIPQDHNHNFLHPSLGGGGGGGGSSTHFLNNINPLTLSSSSSSNPQLLPPPSLYDPSPSLFLAFSQPTSSSLLNLTRPDHGCNDLGSLAAANASFSGQPALGTTPLSSDHQTTAVASSHGPSAQPQVPGPTRNPKKRTRASRRAPTTVLTTDTSNFRAMVQEFTGIPAPPFSSSPYSRTRLDLFGSSSAGSTIIRSAPTSHHFDPMGAAYINNSNIGGLNPLRPSPQKYPSSNNSATSNSSFNIIDPASSVGYNHQLGCSASDHILRQHQQQSQNMLNMQNQVISFQSLINPGITHPLHHPLGANKSPLASLEELGSLGHGLAGSNSWRDGASGSTQDHHNGSQRGGDQRLRPFDGSCKLNYSSDHFHHDKGLEGANSNNVPSRGDQGTLDSWICPSD